MTRKIKLGFYSFMAALDISIIVASAQDGDAINMCIAGFALSCFALLLGITLASNE